MGRRRTSGSNDAAIGWVWAFVSNRLLRRAVWLSTAGQHSVMIRQASVRLGEKYAILSHCSRTCMSRAEMLCKDW